MEEGPGPGSGADVPGKLAPLVEVGDVLHVASLDVEAEANAPMLVGVVAPENGILPRAAEAQEAEPGNGVTLPPIELTPPFAIRELHGEELERIIQIVEPRDLEALAREILDGPRRCEKMIDTGHPGAGPRMGRARNVNHEVGY